MAGWAYDWLHWPWQHTWSASAGPCAKTDTEVTLHGDGVGRRACRRAELGRLIHMRPPVHAAVPSNSSAYRRHHHRGFGGETPLVERGKQMSGYVNSFKRRARGPEQQYRRCRSTVDSDSKSGPMFGQLESAQRVAGDDLAVHAQSGPSVVRYYCSHPPRRPRHSPTVRPSALLSSRVPLAAQDHPGVDRAGRREEVRDPTLSDTRLE